MLEWARSKSSRTSKSGFVLCFTLSPRSLDFFVKFIVYMAPHNNTVIWAFPVSQLRSCSWKQLIMCVTLCYKTHWPGSAEWEDASNPPCQKPCRLLSAHPGCRQQLFVANLTNFPLFLMFLYCSITYDTFSQTLDQLKSRGMIPETILLFSCCERFLRTKQWERLKTSGMEKLVRDWCHGQDKCLVILTQPRWALDQ